MSMSDEDIALLLAEKADISFVQNNLLPKADRITVQHALNEKANLVAILSSLATKANLADLIELDTDKANKATTYTKAEVLNLLDHVTSATIVADYTALLATVDYTRFVWVLDATDDPSNLYTGIAVLYRYDATEPGSWIPFSTASTLAGIVNWSLIVGAPSSSVAELDDAVTKSHAHANDTVLDLLTTTPGNLVFNSRTLAYVDIDREPPVTLAPTECVLNYTTSAYWKVTPAIDDVTPSLFGWVDGAKGRLQVFNGGDKFLIPNDWNVYGVIPDLQTDGFDVFEIHQYNTATEGIMIFIKHVQVYTNSI